MGVTTIEWTATKNADGSWTPGYTFNPWWGCQRVSPGCERCYAETFAHRYGFEVWGPAKTTQRRVMSEKYWAQPLRWNSAAERAGTRARVFCASMADVFEDHPQVVPLRARLWERIEQTPYLDWLLLTKRPQHLRTMLPAAWLIHPRPNVWLGTSTENQEYFDTRIELLLNTPAVVHFLSCEPLLGPIDIGGYRPSWLIIGGESGAGARPMHPAWARSLRDQAQRAGIAYFFKQWGEYAPGYSEAIRAGRPRIHMAEDGATWPATTRVMAEEAVCQEANTILYRVGKHTAGRLLDGQEWNEYPSVRSIP